MSTSKRKFHSFRRHGLLFAAVVLAAGVCARAGAQTTAAPQLLPYTVTAVAGGGAYGSSAGYYNNGANTVCSYQSWTGTAYATKADSNHTPLDTVGDGCLATEALLTSPRAAVADSQGNVFFIDSANDLIRRVDAHTGVVTRVAGVTIASTSSPAAPTFASIATQTKCPVSGNTQQDAYGDGCLATEVPMASPEALALDAQGNIWFTDYYLGAVREIVKSTGLIQTVVNQSVSINPGISSNGFTWAKGTGYVGYNATNVTASYGNYGGSGGAGGIGSLCAAVSSSCYVTAAQALLFRPYGLGFDRQGNLYIAENYNNLVDVVNLSNTTRIVAGYTLYPQEVLTIAGTGCPARWDTYTLGESVSSSSSPTQANMSCDSSSYYGHSNGASPYPSTGSTLDSPYQVSVDNSGNIYIADEYPYDVRVIAGASGYTLPGGTALGVGDIGAFAGVPNSARSATAALTRGLATSTKLSGVYGVAVDAPGNVYIADYASTSNYLERVDIATGYLYAIAGQLTTAAPTTADIAPAGATYCSSPGSMTPFLTGYTDDVGDGCPGLKATVYKTYFPSLDAAGNLYVSDAGNGLIRKLSAGTQFPATAVGTPVTQTLEIHFGANDSPSTAVSAYALPPGITEFSLGAASCGAANSDGTMDCTLPVTFTPAHAGTRTAGLTVTSSEGLLSTFALTGTGLAPLLAIDPGTQATVASSGVAAVDGLAVDNAGDVYAAVPGSGSIVAIAAGGAVSNIGSGLTGANAVAIDAAGNLYAALAGGTVVEVPANGGSQVTIGSGFTDPAGLALDAYGNVYVADEAASSVTEIVAGTGVQVVLANQTSLPNLDEPTGVAVDSYGNVFVSSTVANSVIELPFNGSAALTLGSGLESPLGLSVDPAGSLYVADSKNGRIVFIPNESGTLNSADQITIVSGLATPTGVAVAGNGTIYISDSYANAVYSVTRSAASINFGNATVAVGTVPAQTLSASADIISMGTQAATFGSAFYTLGGNNPGDYNVSPASIPVSSEFPSAGYGVALTASFTPTETAPAHSSALASFDATNVTPPVLALSGAATKPSETATTSITAPPPSPQTSWIYGQTVVINITVTPNNLNAQETPGGTVTVTVDGTPYPNLSFSASAGYISSLSLNVVALSAGPHTVAATYNGDVNFGSSVANSILVNVAPAPLTITGGTLYKPFDAPLPTLTGTLSGVQNGDVIGVNYSTTAQWNSPVIGAGYPIVPSVSGSALSNYTVTLNNGTLYVTQDSTLTTLGASATSVNSTTQVTLTATVANQVIYAGGTAPTGYVAFFNTVGGTKTQIGSNAPLNAGGMATLTTTFAVVSGQASTLNNVTAQYLGDPNFVTSTSAALGVTSGVPTFALTASGNSSLTVEPGQTGLMSFTLAPAYGYNGTITFSCTGLPAGASCAFSPASLTANGQNTSSLVTLSITTQQPQSPVSRNNSPGGVFGSGGLPRSLALLPGVLLLCGLGARRRKLLRAARLLAAVALLLAGWGITACGGISVAGTPAGTDTVTVVASGTGGSFASVTQQFTVSLKVQ